MGGGTPVRSGDSMAAQCQRRRRCADPTAIGLQRLRMRQPKQPSAEGRG